MKPLSLRRSHALLCLAGIALFFLTLRLRSSFVTVNLDFEEFYAAAQMLRHGDATLLRSSLYPAAHVLLFLPLTWLPLKAAYAVWTALNIVLLLVSISLLERELGTGERDWLPFALIVFPGVLWCLLFGQLSLVMLLLYTCALVQLRRGKHLAAGILVGLGAIKFHLVLGFVLIMLLRRVWRFVLGAAIGGGAIVLVSVALVGVRQMSSYPSHLRAIAHDPQISKLWMMVNLRGLFFSVTGHEPAVWLVALGSIALLFFATYLWRDTEVGFPCAVLVSTITAYHAYPQELCLFIPFLILVITRIRNREAALLATSGGTFLALALAIWSLFPLFPVPAVGLLAMIAWPGQRRWPSAIESPATRTGV